MMMFTPNQIKMLHDERVRELLSDTNKSPRNTKKVRDWTSKLLKRNHDEEA